MIKRELHTAITNRDIEEILDHISGETKIVSHVVDSLGTHYIITERQMTEDEMANLYMQRREDLIEEYNEEQRKLTIKHDKLQKSL